VTTTPTPAKKSHKLSSGLLIALGVFGAQGIIGCASPIAGSPTASEATTTAVMTTTMIAPTTQAAPPPAPAPDTTTECCAHEFDWAGPYFAAFERHGIGYLSYEPGIPLANQADWVCAGEVSRDKIRDSGVSWAGTPRESGRRLTDAEVEKVIEAAYDVCPEARNREAP
jgi:hypothetical protein